MGDLRRSVTLERALQLLIVATVVTAVLAAGSLIDVLGPARKVRWFCLALLAVAAAAYAIRRRGDLRLGMRYAPALVFLALAAVSTAWSAYPGLTFARTASLAIVFAAAAGVALGATGRLDALRRMLQALVAGAATVAIGGLLVLLFAHDRAVQPASAQEPARYQGLGGGPNTAAMLLAVALPLAAYAAVEARSGRGRTVALAGGLLLLGSIVASGSRGALVAAFAGLAVYAALATPGLGGRAIVLAGVALLLAASIVAARLPKPDPSVAARPGTALPQPPAPPEPGYFDASVVWRLQEDIGRPPYGQTVRETSRSVLGLSGRRQAWGGALRLGAERPTVGYAFGTENKVFVDRYLAHGSNLPENSYIGLFLQLGVAGLLAFAALVVALVAGARRALARPRAPAGRLAAAFGGALAAGLVLALTQSYIYAAGSNATAALWLSAFLLPAAGATLDAEAS